MTYSQKIYINPQKLMSSNCGDLDSQFVLRHLFNESNKEMLWHGNHVYRYRYKNVEYQFTFSQSILKRSRKEGKTGFKFDVFNPSEAPKGKGGYAVVYPIVATYIQNSAGEMALKPGKKKLVKIEDHSVRDRTASVQREYQNLLKAGHLGAKKPIILAEKSSKKSYLVMEDVEGFVLEQILNPTKYPSIAHQIPKLTVYMRLELTLAILRAIKAQAVDKGLLHRDIKPGNMIVDLNQNPPKVKLIDFGFAIDKKNQDHHRLGTRAYRAPESFDNNPIYTFKSDIYSVGRLLSYLWGDDYHNYYMNKSKEYPYIRTKSTNEHLFSLPAIHLFLTDADKHHIRKYLNQTLSEDPDDRPNIDQLINLFSKIDKEQYRAFDEKKYSIEYLEEFKRKLNPQLQLVEQHLELMKKKEADLWKRGHVDAAREMGHLIVKIEENTHFLQDNPNPDVMLKYRKSCLDEINSSQNILKQHRDSYWIVAEVASAIALLGVGYLLAVGLNYYQSGRVGLFSQTKADHLACSLKEIIPVQKAMTAN